MFYYKCFPNWKRLTTCFIAKKQVVFPFKGYKGVSWDKEKNKWAVRISVNGINKHGGYYDDLKDAAQASIDLSKKHMKEFSHQ